MDIGPYLIGGVFVIFVIAQLRRIGRMPSRYVCTQCYRDNNGVRKVPGSLWITLILIVFAIVPGIVYEIWRCSASRIVCATCRHDSLIPAKSPHGRALMGLGPRVPR
jgi:hypothetical protein